eukprot:scaffold7033_cov257-Pinguiococcus_pyrenoidosus.AAC.34
MEKEIAPDHFVVSTPGVPHVRVALAEAVWRQAFAVDGVKGGEEPVQDFGLGIAALRKPHERCELVSVQHPVQIDIQRAEDAVQRMLCFGGVSSPFRSGSPQASEVRLLRTLRLDHALSKLASGCCRDNQILSGRQHDLVRLVLPLGGVAAGAHKLVGVVGQDPQHGDANVEVRLGVGAALDVDFPSLLPPGRHIRTRVLDHADVDGEEVLQHVLKAHPKGAIFVVEGGADFFPQLVRPQLRVIRPVPCPLKVAPRVPHLEELMLTRGLPDLQERIRVAMDEAGAVLLGTLASLRVDVFARRRRRHDVAPLIPLQEALPQPGATLRVLKRFFVQPDGLVGRARQIQHRLVCIAHSNGRVGAVQLGVGLLQQQHPELVPVGLAVGRPTARIAREVVVHHDALPLSVLAEPHFVDAVATQAPRFRQEQPRDQ